MARKCIITVIGTTGVGKSALAVQLARHINGHIINGDSMQVYKGMDVITNKPDIVERNLAPHHLFDFIEPDKEYSVSEYTTDCLSTIDQIHLGDGVPVIVGGTNYYIQSVLCNESIIETADTPGLSNKASVKSSRHHSLTPEIADTICYLLEMTDSRVESNSSILEFARTVSLHSTLQLVDPVMAGRWHPNDLRKIRRSLEIYYTTGRTHTQWFVHQKTEASENRLRYPTCVFWIYGHPDELNPRLDARVDQMIEKGLFDEIREMRAKIGKSEVIGIESDYTRGILQAIGFKEFRDYLDLSADSIDGGKLRAVGVENMKIATRQYASRQIAWIKNRLAPILAKEHLAGSGAIYLIDASEANAITQTLLDKIVSLSTDFINGEANEPITSLAPNLGHLLQNPITHIWKQYTCDVCVDKNGRKKLSNGSLEWDIHLKSRGHRTAHRRIKESSERQAWTSKNIPSLNF